MKLNPLKLVVRMELMKYHFSFEGFTLITFKSMTIDLTSNDNLTTRVPGIHPYAIGS